MNKIEVTREEKKTAVSLAQHAQTAPDKIAQKSSFRQYKPLAWTALIQQSIDTTFIAAFGGILNSALAVLMALIVLPSSALDAHGVVLLVDMALWIGLTSSAIWFACACLPVWLGLTFFALQALAGTFVGGIIVWSICYYTMVDPPAHFALMAWSAIFTFTATILPAFALPIYTALCHSSKFGRTLGALLPGFYVTNLKGQRLAFNQAFKRSLLSALEPFLYPLSIALGKDYPDRQTWLNQESSTMIAKRADKLEEEINKSSGTVMVRYRAFQELEAVSGRDSESVPKVMRKIDVPFRRASHGVWALSVVTLATSLPVAFLAPVGVARLLLLKGGFNDAAAAHAVNSLAGFGNFGFTALTYAFAGLLLYILLAACRPTHVQLTKNGLRFISNFMPGFMQDRVCAWNDVAGITLEQMPGKASIADHRLVFNLNNGKKIRLRLGSIGSLSGKEEILRAVERWAPTLPRTAESVSALQPPCDFSYTELWMEALTAPPKREKLKPLIDGAQLRANQYTVKKMLGVGGQGTAYLAEDALKDSSVVLKEFLLPVYVDVSARRRALETFEQEARLLKELSHPNIVELLDYFIEDHRAYLVLEHIDGRSLRQIVNQDGMLNESDVRNLARQMCLILQYLHDQTPPVVHRDFTPDNLILRKDGTLKLIDFNVAHQAEESSALSSVVGKPNYLAPEQFRGAPVPESDIYALGACLYFLLTGSDPVAIISSNPREARVEISPELAAIVEKATEPELSDRFASASQILLELEA